MASVSRPARKSPAATPSARIDPDLVLEFGVERGELITQLGWEAVVGREGVTVARDRRDVSDELLDRLGWAGDDAEHLAEAVDGVVIVGGGGVGEDAGDVGVVAVEGGSGHSGGLGDGHHGDAGQTVFADEGEGGVDDAFTGRGHDASLV